MHFLALFLFAACLPFVWLLNLTALDEFVRLPDSHYEYKFVNEHQWTKMFGAASYNVTMTSQKWLDESEVDKPIWKHELRIAVPTLLRSPKLPCLLIIDPGENDELTSGYLFSDRDLYDLARKSRSIVAVLSPGLMQPLTFYKHPLGHANITGYEIIAYTWWRYMNDSSKPPHWLALFPMVKATVKAMDTITEVVTKNAKKIATNFTLAGVATGGWATWLTAAVDSRVKAIVPIAMDLLNLTKNFQHLYKSYCGWSYMLKPFYDLNITQRIKHPRFIELASHVDPLAYNERFAKISKYIIIITGDEVFQPDNSHYYYSQLKGNKLLLIIPNTDYRFQGSKTLWNPLLAFQSRIAKGYSFPKTYWQRTTDEVDKILQRMRLTTCPLDPSPLWFVKTYHAETNTTGFISLTVGAHNRVYTYHADTVDDTRRDFRMKIAAGNSSQNNPVKWIRSGDYYERSGKYRIAMEIPAKGWKGFFLQSTVDDTWMASLLAPKRVNERLKIALTTSLQYSFLIYGTIRDVIIFETGKSHCKAVGWTKYKVSCGF